MKHSIEKRPEGIDTRHAVKGKYNKFILSFKILKSDEALKIPVDALNDNDVNRIRTGVANSIKNALKLKAQEIATCLDNGVLWIWRRTP